MATSESQETITITTQRLFRVLTESLRNDAGLREGDGVLVACSGGGDSVALLRALQALAPKRRWRLRVEAIHVQHHLRNSAEADAAFVAKLCRDLDIQHHRVDVDLRHGMTDGSNNVEARARRARLEAFVNVAESRGLRHVATAHHAGDQLETVLMRLMRGSAVEAMAGIRPTRPLTPDVTLIRPLLRIDRSTLHGYLRGLHQTWCEDETNADTTRLRAALRAHVTPELLRRAPALPERLAEWSTHAASVGRLLRDAADRLTFPMKRDRIRQANEAVFLRALRSELVERGVGPDALSASHLKAIRRAAMDPSGRKRVFEFPSVRVLITPTDVDFEANQTRAEAC
ncbi:MAG: tRNA lysidine(34) synthetase TilS [Planctomycetota bacterium]